MTLETYYFLSVSIVATLFAVGLLVGLGACVWILLRLRVVFRKIEDIAESAQQTVSHIQEAVHVTKERLLGLEQALMTLHGLQGLAGGLRRVVQKKKSIISKKGNSHDNRKKETVS